MARYSEERLGELLGLLRPAPTGWTRAAQELPFARRSLDSIVEQFSGKVGIDRCQFPQEALQELRAPPLRRHVAVGRNDRAPCCPRLGRTEGEAGSADKDAS